MSNLARTTLLAALACTSQFLVACGQDCGQGTIRQGDQCVPERFNCGAGTVLSDGACVAVVDACGDGTSPEGSTCVIDDPSGACAEGTQYDVAIGRCVTVVAGACGLNTILVDDTCVVAARLQVIHALDVANAAVVDLYVDGLLVVNDFPYRTASRFLVVPAGAHTIGIALPESGSDVGDPIPETGAVEADVDTNAVTDNVAVMTGISTATFAVASRSIPRAVDPANVAFTFVHASPDAPSPVDLEHEGANHTNEADDQIIVDDVAFAASSPVISMEASRFVLGLADGSGNDLVRYRASWENLGGSAFTLVASGFLNPADDAPALEMLRFPTSGGAGVPLPLFD